MKRRGNVISPIDTIGTVVEMLQQSDSSVEDGEICWVRSTQCLWVYRVNSGLTPDGTNVVASLYGNGVWQRFSPSTATLGQTAWFIDPVNGNDANSGKTASTALKTDAERQRRWGAFAEIIAPTTVNYLSTLSVTDFVNYNCAILPGGSLVLQGTRTQLKTGAFTAVTALNRGTQTPWSVTQAGLGAADVGKIIRITAGPRLGAYAGVAKNNGAGNVRVSPFGTFAPVPFAFFTQVTPQIGDAFEVVDLPVIQVGDMHFSASSNVTPTGTPASPAVQIDSLFLEGNFGNGVMIADAMSVFLATSIVDFVSITGSAGIVSIGGGILTGAQIYAGLNFAIILSSLVQTQFNCFEPTNFIVNLDGDVLFQAALFNAIGCVVGGTVSIFDAPTGDNAMFVSSTGRYLSLPLFVGVDLLWGTNNAGHGARVQSGAEIIYVTKPTINGGLGAGREANVGGTDKLWGAIPFVNPANNAMIVVQS